jgi:zona occludens toxin (predicted ATPase)
MSMIQDIIRLPMGLLGVSANHYDGLSHSHKFGAVPAMSQNQTGTIWDVNDTNYPWSSFASAGTLSVPAVNASDNGKTIRIIGLNASYDEIQEDVTVSSAEATATSNSFIRVYRAFVTNGSATNVANIDVQKGGTTVLRISAEKGQTLMAIYTVPAGYTAYMLKGVATCQSGADATGDMFVRYFGDSAFRVGHSFEVSGSGGEYMYDFGIPLRIPEKSDIDIRASVRSNNARLTAAFDILLERD